MSFLHGNQYANYERNRFESISMPSSVQPWQPLLDTSPASHCRLSSCNVFSNPRSPVIARVHSVPRVSSSSDSFRPYCELPNMPYCTGLTPFMASRCSKTARAKRKEKIFSMKLKCEICKMTFLSPSAIKVHMRIHNGERPFRCPHCPRAFSQSGNLTVHMRKHTGEKPFMCSMCLKRFTHSNSLKVHIRTHTGEKPYQCMACKKRFGDRSTLVRHLTIHRMSEEEA